MQEKWTRRLLSLALLAALAVPASLSAAPQGTRPAPKATQPIAPQDARPAPKAAQPIAPQDTTRPAPKAAQPIAPQDVRVAVVNGTPIYKSELEREMKSAKFQREATGNPMGEEELKALPEKVLNQLIGRTLLYHAAQKKGIKVTDQAMKERTEIWRKQYPPQASMDEILKAMGMTEAMVQAEIRKGLIIEQFLTQTIPQNVEVSDKEIMDYVEKNLKEQVRDEVREQKINQAVEKYVDDLKSKAQIEVLLKKTP